MTGMDRPDDIPDSILAEAAEWLTALAAGELPQAERRALAAWLTRSPMHIEALLSAGALKARFAGELKAHSEWFPDVLAELELDENVVPLMAEDGLRAEPVTAETSARRHVWVRSRRTAGGLAAGVAGLVVSLWLALAANDAWLYGWQSYQTELGEQRSLVLGDGSVVQLNTQSALRARFSQDERRIELIRGEAVFDVAKDPARPFRVQSGDVTVEAIGTRFNVYRQAGSTVVTVVEGRVSVSPTASTDPAVGGIADVPEPAPPAFELTAGEQVSLPRQGAVTEAIPVDIEAATAWTQRRIALSGHTLEQAAREFNRYNRTQLTIVDSVLSERRITGVFNANDPDAFVAFIAGSVPVRIVERPDGGREIHTLDGPE